MFAALILFSAQTLEIRIGPRLVPLKDGGAMVTVNFTNRTAKPVVVSTSLFALDLRLYDARGKRMTSNKAMAAMELRSHLYWDELKVVAPHGKLTLPFAFFPLDEKLKPDVYSVRGSFLLKDWPEVGKKGFSSRGKLLPGGPIAIPFTSVRMF